MSSPFESLLSELLGCPIEVETAVPGSQFHVRIRGINRPHGFRVVIQRRFSWMEASLSFDRLSSHIRSELATALVENHNQFEMSLSALTVMGVGYRDVPVASSSPEGDLRFDGFSSRVSIDSQPSVWEAERLSTLSILIPIIQLLDPDVIEGVPRAAPEEVEAEYDREGRVSYRWSRQYERSAANRALAIALHGRTCKVCRLNFDDLYGSIAAGYVEIHHLLPVSSMGGPATVDPRTDLVPLCANCHRMAHRKWPPYTPAELSACISRTDLD